MLPAIWHSGVLGPPGALNTCWEGMADTSFVQNHQFLTREDWDVSIPVGFHWDAGSFSHQESVFLFSWNSLVSGGEDRPSKRFLFTLLKKSDIVEGTIDRVMTLFAWSMNACLTGIQPATNHLGFEIPGGGKDWIADGYRGILTQIRWDWDLFVQIFSFPRWDGADNMCWMCGASGVKDSPLAFLNCGVDALWRDTRRSHEDYLEELLAAGKRPAVLLTEALGLRLECVMVDVLHAVDQGIASHIIANMFWWSCSRVRVGWT